MAPGSNSEDSMPKRLRSLANVSANEGGHVVAGSDGMMRGRAAGVGAGREMEPERNGGFSEARTWRPQRNRAHLHPGAREAERNGAPPSDLSFL